MADSNLCLLHCPKRPFARSDSSMADSNATIQRRRYIFLPVQIPLWPIVTSGAQPIPVQFPRSDSSMADSNSVALPCLSSAKRCSDSSMADSNSGGCGAPGGIPPFRFLYGR